MKNVTENGQILWVGCNGFKGVSLLLTDRIATKVYFSKSYVDPILSQGSWTLAYTDVSGTRHSYELDSVSIQNHDRISATDSAYALSLPSVAASDFHKSFTVYVENFGTVEFSVMS